MGREMCSMTSGKTGDGLQGMRLRKRERIIIGGPGGRQTHRPLLVRRLQLWMIAGFEGGWWDEKVALRQSDDEENADPASLFRFSLGQSEYVSHQTPRQKGFVRLCLMEDGNRG